jgi:hypothetical protein
MNDNAQAKEILTQARDHLVERIVNRIVEAREEILDDAMGESYMGEIEVIYEQLGGRLNHVNAMLANMPAAEKAESRPAGETTKNLESPENEKQAASFETFVREIRRGDIEAAGAALAELFEVDAARGQRCATVFADRLRQEPEFMVKAMTLRGHLASGSHNASLMLLWECFGLQGLEAIQVMELLQTRMMAT